MPRLLQEALQLSRTEEEGRAPSEGKVVSRRKTNRIGAGPPASGSAHSSSKLKLADTEHLLLRAP
jgi:hypothetical protein